MPTGRLDGLVSSTASADSGLVSTDTSAQELTQKFLAQGLGQDEMITLSGMNPKTELYASFFHANGACSRVRVLSVGFAELAE